MACVRSGISGWVIGLLIGWRAAAERRAANTWSPVLADSEARRRFLFGNSLLEIPLTEGSAFHLGFAFPRAREGGASATGFDPAAPAPSYGTLRREPIETADRGVAVACVRSGISGWVIGLLIGWRAAAERRAANTWSPVLADSEARRRFLLGLAP